MENNRELAFEKSSVIQELNKVEGFNPLDYVTSNINDRNEEYINLETKYRQLWFRLRYPHGKVTKKVLRLTDTVAAVEARVYIDRNDPEENYVASGVAQRFFDATKDFGLYYLESAETIAEGRALGKAGFGIQFCDFDGQKDDVMPDTGVKVQSHSNSAASKPADKPKAETAKETAKSNQQVKQITANEIPIKPDKKNDSVQPESGNTTNQAAESESEGNNTQKEAPEEQNSVQQSILAEKPREAAEIQADNGSTNYDETTPVEEILKVMTIEEAENVSVTVGFNRGKTLRQVSLANHRQLRWFFESYNGENNILKAGAKLLFTRTEEQQKKAS